MTDEPLIKGAPPAPGEAEAAAAERVAEGLPDVELDESGFDAKLQELRDKGFRTDSGARALDDENDVAVFGDGTDVYADAPHAGPGSACWGSADRTADRPESGRVPDAPGDDEPIPEPPLEPLEPFDGNPPPGGADDFFETLGGIPERESAPQAGNFVEDHHDPEDES